MRIAAILAMSENRVIGKDNRLPWHLPADLQHFKEITMGKPIIMGRRTYESIGKPLPGRCNVIVSADTTFQACGCVVARSIETALSAVSYSNEVMVIGGALIFQQMLPLIQRLYLTVIHHVFNGDTFFPELNMLEWQQKERVDHPANEKNVYPYSFVTLDRR